MNLEGHAKVYGLSVIILTILNYTWLHFTTDWTFFIRLTLMFLINPDIDLLFMNLFGKGHRNVFTHSALLPLTFYWAISTSIGENVNVGNLCILFFFPVFIHLIADFKITTVFQAIAEDVVDKLDGDNKFKSGNEKTGGTWRITLRPLIDKSFSFYGTLIWIIGNLIFMVLFTLFKFNLF